MPWETSQLESDGMSTSWGLLRLWLDAQIAFGIKLVQWSLELTSE